MTALRCGILALVFSVVVPGSAHAADILLNGEVPCLSIGGTWSDGTCTVDKLHVPADTRLYAYSIGLSAGKVIVDGSLEIWGGSFRVTRSLVNRGQLTTYSFVVITGPMWNQGTWTNRAGFSSEHTVVNERSFYNYGGTFQSAVFINKGGVFNYTGSIWNSGSLLNKGYMLNAGYVYNPVGAIIENSGAIENYDGTFFNAGTALSLCGSAWYFQRLGPFPTTPVGNPVEFQPCSAAHALNVLGNYVLKLGRQRVLSEADTMGLANLLFRARVLLKWGREDEAIEVLYGFNAEVRGRVGGSGWYGLGSSLILRANRVVELIELD